MKPSPTYPVAWAGWSKASRFSCAGGTLPWLKYVRFLRPGKANARSVLPKVCSRFPRNSLSVFLPMWLIPFTARRDEAPPGYLYVSLADHRLPAVIEPGAGVVLLSG